MAYQSEVSRMLLAVKPSPGSGVALAAGLPPRAGSSCGSRTSSSLLFSRVAAARGGAGGAGSGSSSDVGSKSVLKSSSSSLLRASSTLRAAAAAAGTGFLAGSGAAAALAASGVLGHAPPAAGSAAAVQQQQHQFVVHFRGQQTSIGFLLSKVLELLKHHAGRTLHVKEVEKALIHNGFNSLHLFFQSNSEFLKLLGSNERVAYNPVHRTLAFHNPYQAITSCNALLARIRYDGALTGAGSHQANPAAAAACDVYATRKCINCRQNLVGLLLYPLADEIYEDARMSLDAEVKGLWDAVELPSLEDIVKECHPRRGLPRLGSGLEQPDTTRCKRQPDSKRASRYRSKFRRIQNTHLFTAEELRSISDQQ